MLTNPHSTFASLVSDSDNPTAEIVSEKLRKPYGSLCRGERSLECLPSKIAICFSSNVDFAQALCYADGQVETLLILSPSMNISTIENLLKSSQTDVLFTDRDDLNHLWNAQPLSELHSKVKVSYNTRWLLATSGTTSEPKLVSHSLASLTRTVTVNTYGRNFVWGQLYDSARFAGMQVLLQAISGGSKFVTPQTGLALCKKIELFANEGVTALSATPTLWRKILMVEGSKNLNLRSITLGGEIADQTILDALSTHFPDAKIRHIYASTEAGAGFSVSDGKAGFPVSYLTNPSNGINIRVDDNILYIQNTLVKSNYIGGNKSFVTEDGFVNTGDQVEIINDRILFKGRVSGIINVGGDKVHPESVESRLNTVTGVKLCRIFGKKSPLVGQLVVCEVVTQDGADPCKVEKALRVYSMEKLATYERPIMYKFIKEIPISKSGKVQR